MRHAWIFLLAAVAFGQDEERAAALAEASARARESDNTLALLLARAAVDAADVPPARTALYDALGAAREQAVCGGFRAPVTSVVFGPGGKELVAAGADGAVARFTVDGKELARFACGRPVKSARYLGDALLVESADGLEFRARDGERRATIPAERFEVAGDALLAWTGAGRVELWNAGGRILEREARDAGLCPDRPLVYVQPAEGAPQLLTAAGARVADLPHAAAPAGHVWRPGGRLYTFGGDATIRVWDADGRDLGALEAKGRVAQAVVSPDGARMLTCDGQGTVQSWDLETRRPTTLPGEGAVAGLAFARFAGGDYYAVARAGRRIQVYRGGGELVLVPPLTDEARHMEGVPGGFVVDLAGGGRDVVALGPVPPPQGTPFPLGPEHAVLAGDGPHPCLATDAPTGPVVVELRAHGAPVTNAALSPDGRLVATASEDGTARVWRVRAPGVLAAGEPLWHCGMPWVKDTIYALAVDTLSIWRTDGTLVARLRQPTPIRWWAYARGSPTVAVVPADRKYAELYDVDGRSLARLEHEATVRGVWMAARGEVLLTWAEDQGVRLWDAAGRWQQTFQLPAKVHFAMPAPDREHTFVATIDGRARILSRDGSERAVWLPPEPIQEVRFSNAGDRFLSRTATTGTVRLWDLDGHELAEMPAHAQPPTRMRFSMKGDLLLTCDPEGLAIVWSGRGQYLGAIDHPAAVTYATFLPGDDRILTTCEDGVTRLWTRRAQLLAEIQGHRGAVPLASFDETGKWVTTCGADGLVRVWPVDREELRAAAARACPRDFTAAERARYAALLR